MKTTSLAILTAVCFMLGNCVLAADNDRLTTLDGTNISAPVTAITADGKVTYGSDQKQIDLQELRSIRRPIESEAGVDNRIKVYLLGGGTLLTDSAVIRENTLKVKVLGEKSLQLPLEYVRGVRFDHGNQESQEQLEAFENALLDTEMDSDRIYAWSGDKLTPVRCVVVSLDAEKIQVKYRDELRDVSREKLAGVVLTSTTDAPGRSGHALVTLSDSSTIWGNVGKLQDDVLQLAVFPAQTIEIPWNSVSRLAIRSEKMVYASDLEPARVQQESLVTHPWQYRRDANVHGGELVLDDRKYEKGLGTHSHCRLTYRTNRDYTGFSATIGIDDNAGSEGDCVFVVYTDGKKQFEQRLTAGTPAKEIKVDIADSMMVSLEVRAGENLDLGDQANWCDARFLKE